MVQKPDGRQRKLEPEIVQAWVDACALGEIDTATLAGKIGCDLDAARGRVNAVLKAAIEDIVAEKRKR